MVARKKTKETSNPKPKTRPRAKAKPNAKAKSHSIKRVSHKNEVKIELSPLREEPVARQENVVCIVKVRKPGYVPEGFSVRTWIDDTLFTADCSRLDLKNAATDPNVESISPAERVRQIG